MNKNNSSIDFNIKTLKIFKAECFWCYEIMDLLSCRSCKRIFCKACITGISKEDEEMFVCIICKFLENSKVRSNTFVSNDEELIRMLDRFKSVYNKNELSKKATLLLEDIDSMDMEEIQRGLSILLGNIHSMFNDFQRLSKAVNEAVKLDDVDSADRVYLPLFKVIIKDHIFNRLGRLSQHFQSPEQTFTLNKNVRSEFEERIEFSPMNVSKEEKDIDIMEINYDEDLICDVKSSVKIIPSLKEEPKSNYALPFRKSMNWCHQNDMPNMGLSNESSVDGAVKEELRLTEDILSPYYSLKSFISNVGTNLTEKILKQNCRIINADFNSVEECVRERNDQSDMGPKRGTVAAAIELQQKSFVINDLADISLSHDTPPTLNKKWSWERSIEAMSTTTISSTNISNNDLLTKSTSKIYKTNKRRKDLTENYCETKTSKMKREKGRPRKYEQ